MLDKFETKIVGYEGSSLKPHTVFGVGIKSKDSKFKGQFEKFRKKCLKINGKSKLTSDMYCFFVDLKNVLKTALKINSDSDIKYYRD